MKPCDCYDSVTTLQLDEQGLRFNEWSIVVKPSSVYITNNTTKLRIPQNRFKAMAEWYLEDQKKG
jgi:hypothetical protein